MRIPLRILVRHHARNRLPDRRTTIALAGNQVNALLAENLILDCPINLLIDRCKPAVKRL
jgi:hypothetical protein